MSKMKAMRIYGPNDWRFEEVEIPELEAYEININ